MTTDALRAHVLYTWVIAIALCYALFVVCAFIEYAGLTFEDIKAPARDLLAASGPSLIALLGAYFAVDTKSVRLTKGQRGVVLLFSYIYAVALVVISAAMLFIDSIRLNQDAIPPHPAINHFVILTHLQPLVLAPLFFLFGKSAKPSTA